MNYLNCRFSSAKVHKIIDISVLFIRWLLFLYWLETVWILMLQIIIP